MPETPDFNAIAASVVERIDTDLKDEHEHTRDQLTAYISKILKQQWNSRGAADMAIVTKEFIAIFGNRGEGSGLTKGMSTVADFERAIRSLDR